MSKCLICIILMFIMLPVFLAADLDVIDYDVSVSADANLVLSGGPYSDAFWVETDETLGIVVLRFRDGRLAELQPCEAPFLETFRLSLKLKVADIADAGSEDGLIAYYNGMEVGRTGRAARGADLIIPLDSFAVSPAEEIVIILRGAGPDGLAIASGASGSGASLRVVAFPEDNRYDDFSMIEEALDTAE